MRQRFNRVLAAALVLILVFSMVPAVSAAQAAELTPDQYRYYAYNGGGDPLYQGTWGLSTPEGVDDYMTFIQELGFCRVYWRGLEWAILGNQIGKRSESAQVMAARGAIHAECYGPGNHFDDPETEKIETVDTYAVEKAHALGLSIVGVTGINIFGGNGDEPAGGYPYTYVSLLNQNGISGPLDPYGYEEKGATIDYSNQRARELAINAMMEEVTYAGYDGVQFITYTETYQLRYDDQFGYSDEAIAEFEKRYGFAPGYGNFDAFGSQEDWRRLQGEYFTEFLREMKLALQAYDSDATLGVNVDSRRPRYLQQWGTYGTADRVMIGDGIFQDFETWAQDRIVDELHVIGGDHWTTQMRVLDDLLWLTRETDTQVVIYTSTAWYEGWERYQKLGVPVLLNNNAKGEQSYYRYGPVVDANSLPTDDAKLRYKLYQIMDGSRSATVEELIGYLEHGGVIIPRMAMTALITRYPDDPRTVEALNSMVTHENSDLRAWAIRELIGKSNGNQVIMNAGSVTAILEALKMDISQPVLDNAAQALSKVADQASDQQLMWDVFTDPNSSLPEKAVTIRGVSATSFYASDAVADQLIEMIEGDAMAVAPDAPQTPENSLKEWIRYYSVARLGISIINNSQKAKDKLLEYIASEDTVVANEALTVLKARASKFTGSDKTRAISALKTVFENLSPDSDVTYATDFKNWAYRPAGEALLAFGDEGKAVLMEFYAGNDPVLAEYAWKCLYMPQSLNSPSVMTEEDYLARYNEAPPAISSYSKIKLSQDFENTNVFNETCNVPAGTSKNVGSTSGTAGAWFVNGGTHVDDQVAHTGSQSFALTPGITGPYTRITVTNGIDNGANYMLSMWVLRQEGVAFGVITTDNATLALSSTYKDFLLQVGADGAVLLDRQNTGLTVPADVWTRIDVEIQRANAINQGTVTVHPEGGTEATSQPIGVTPYSNLTRIVLSHSNAADGGSVWFDDIVWAQSAPARRTASAAAITMESTGMMYDGQPHGLTAVTAPAGQSVSYTYVDSDGNTLDGEPVDAGSYTVTAEITEGDHQGAKATAFLVIRKAPVSVVEVTAGSIDFGMPLAAAQLQVTAASAGGSAPLEGVVSWDAPGTYPITTGEHAWTFVPANPSYQTASGTAQVTLNAGKLKFAPVLSQNFDDTNVFHAKTNSFSVAVGGLGGKTWGPIYSQIGREGGSNILALSDALLDTDPGEVNALYANALTTGTGYTYLRGYLETAVSASEDYQLSFKVYRRSGEDSILRFAPNDYDCSLELYPDGSIKMVQANKAYTEVPDVTVPLETWTTITITAHRETKKADLTVAPAGGTPVTVPDAGAAANKALSYITLYNMSKTTGTTPLFDDIVVSVPVPDQAGYYAGMTPTAEVLLGEEVNVDLNVVSAEETVYNAYAFRVSYDKELLTFTGISEGFTADADEENGILTITGSGTELPVNSAITLTFAADARGTAQVKLTEAQISKTEDWNDGQTSVEFDTCSVLVTGYTVDLPEDFEGDAIAAEGADYTFTAKNKYYDYTFDGSVMGDSAANVIGSGSTFTVKEVNGDLVLVSQKTARRFAVSVAGNANADVIAGDTASYAEDYSFTVQMAADHTYKVTVVVNGKAYAPEKYDSTYTIAGEDIVGDIVITVTRISIPNTPVIEGVVDGGIYCGQQLVTIHDPDGDIAEVLLDGQPTVLQDGKLAIFPRSNLLDRTIQVIDARGKTTTVSFRVYADHSYPEEGTVTKQPSVTEPGEETFVCENGCGVDKVLPIDKLVFHISGVTMTLGNDLSMNFLVEADKVTGEGWYATVIHGSKTVTVPQSEWSDGGDYLRISYNGLAAKEMVDRVTVTVYDAEGNELTVYTDSVRDYAMRMLDNDDDDLKRVMADMLNYGAAAQELLRYKTDDLANSRMTDEQKAYASESVTMNDLRKACDGYQGTSLELESNIVLNFYYSEEYIGKTATVSYTDHYGNACSYEVVVEASGSLGKVSVDKLVISDCSVEVTVTIDGVSVTDSVESYCARMQERLPLGTPLMKFATSARAFFAK